MDRISGLSDELLVKILLFVPTKVAVSTSILSKRWEYLWLWLPKLDYCHRYYSKPESKRLQCFLDRNLPLHRAPVIERFRFESCSSHLKPENISMWISTAVYHKVRELNILYEPYPAKPNILPSNVYTCKTLVILKLDGEILLDVPRMASLPSLKTLELQKVRYVNEDTLQRLLSSCPILEDLLMNISDENTKGKLMVVVPSLQRLSLSIPDNHDIDGFVVETPALKYFKLMDYNYKSQYCFVENMPNLIEAHLDVELDDIKSLIGSITSVKRLSICSETMFDEGFIFNQLEHLEVCLCKEHFSNQLFRLLKASSKLKTLHIFFMNSDHYLQEDMYVWNEPSTVPECILLSLQRLNWSTYTGEPHEREVVVYILKHALHLKTATIKSSYGSDFTELEMLQELSLSSRASTTCEVIFD